MREKKIIYTILDVMFVILVGLIYFGWTTHLMQSWSPDEGMREDVVYWIAQNGKLPIGDEPELINPIWGFSYAFLPYLPSIIGAFFVKVVSLFTSNEVALFIAPRMVSVFAGMGAAFFALKIGKRVFHNRFTDYVFAGFICLLPQFVFICSYFNNDSFSVFSCVVMLYFWISGLQDEWNIKNSIGLGIGIGMCALTYYNAYGFILCSVILYICSWIKKGQKFQTKKFFQMGFLIAGVAIAFAGWYFIRNAIIYNGDFLGIQATRACGEIHAMEQYKPSNRTTLLNQGQPFSALLTDSYWWKMTTGSFIGCFSFMSVLISDNYIYAYYMILGIGTIIGLFFFMKKRNTRLLGIIMLGTMAIPLLLSVYNSYVADYQPQGRYIMSGLPAFALFAACGYDEIVHRLPKIPQVLKNIFIAAILIIWIILLYGVFKDYIYIYCWCPDLQQILN